MTKWSLRCLAAIMSLSALVWVAEAAEQAPSKPNLDAAAAQNSQSEVAKFCINNATAEADAHLAWQKAQIMQMEDELKQKIADLEAKEAENKKWVLARQDLLQKGRDNVVAIFSHMQPESAALQLSAMQDDVAAAVLSKLSPRNASAILDEIDPPRAARLADVMAGNTPSAPGAKKAL
jgi:flagellar motility protein MotE (MotC chaperone)